jgi:lysyl-tRNA synthetase class 1
MSATSHHWADIYADKIIREKGDKELYVCASGITPSGTVHIGNFREIISVDLVVRALRDKGRQVRFIYSWDDYDVFRKVPANMPRPEMLAEYLRQPITLTPDPYGREESYARHNELEMEALLPRVGITPEYIYQAEAYRSSRYAAEIARALNARETIRGLLNEHRTRPLEPDWWPASVFCSSCRRDTTRITGWDGEQVLSYHCDSCGHTEDADLRATSAVKLLWRVDWPMRWAREQVDFEPAGKDHHSEGGSFDTARGIVTRVFDSSAPVSFQYDFISIKGRGGKISSSTGEVVSLKDVLEIYQPEVVRYLFASTRPNTEFAISFDLDVIKIYEDYDRLERIYFGAEKVAAKKAAKLRRSYELSQVTHIPAVLPYQVPFRHLCNLLQINEGDVDAVLASLPEIPAEDEKRLRLRARCAWNWIRAYAPEEFRFSLRPLEEPPAPLSPAQAQAVSVFREDLERNLESYDEKRLSEAIYAAAREAGLEPKDFFTLVYGLLIGRERGPRLAGFILTVGRDRVLKRLLPAEHQDSETRSET